MGPSFASALGLSVCLFIALISNGRPIGAGDTRATERLAASLVQEGDLDLDEYPEVEPPFSKQVGEHRVSIYPALAAVLAAPVFALARLAFELDETGTALAGKIAASLLSAAAAGALFIAVGLRRTGSEAAGTAILFALGTSVWSTSQALWQHPAAVFFIAVALVFTQKAEDDPAWASRAGLPLSLAFAARHADVALLLAFGLGLAIRWPRRLIGLLLWALPGGLLVLGYNFIYFGSPLRHGFSDGLERFTIGGLSHLGLLVSPAKGLFVFTPAALLAVAGLARAARRERWLAFTCAASVVAHWLFIGLWSEWHGGESWGPRMMTDALPLLWLFLPEGFDLVPRLGKLLAILSIAIQMIGAFAYDYRWERLYQRTASDDRALWAAATSPIPFHVRERVLLLSMPGVHDRKATIHQHPIVLRGATGSRITFEGDAPTLRGSEPLVGDVHLQRGARTELAKLRLRGRWDGLFLRVLPAARQRRLELRVSGQGNGTLYVGERSFWSETTRWTTYPMRGRFRIRHPYHFPESGGADLVVTIGRAPGEAELDSVTLSPPGEPENLIQLP